MKAALVPTRFLLALALVVTATGAEESTPLSATFIGNQAVRITDGDLVLFTDFPYQSGASGYMRWDRAALEPADNAYCLITHEHRDHFAPELVAELGCTVLGSDEVVAQLSGGEGIAIEDGTSFGSMKVIPVPTPHIEGHLSYRVEWAGTTLYFTGDTEVTGALTAQEPLDVLFISPWLYRTALEHDALPEVGKVYIYHHATNERVPACRPCAAETGCTPCQVPRQGDRLELSTAPGSPSGG